MSVRKIGRCIAVTVALLGAGAVNASPRQQIIPTPYASAATVIRLAKLGDIRAEAQLGWMYATGRGVPQNFYEAGRWYYLAAQRGHGGAQFELGLMYNKGEQGVPRDLVLAYYWLNLSASQAVGDDRDFKVRIRNAVASKMTIEQVAIAQAMARAWY